MYREKLDRVVLDRMGVEYDDELTLKDWNDFIWRLKSPTESVRIGLVGKYVELKDSYKSIAESFIHAGAANGVKVKVDWIHSESIDSQSVNERLKDLDAILVAPGFGDRGINGKIATIQFAREHKIPFLGICLGMQCAVIEFARNVLGLKGAHSTEMDQDTDHPVIDLMEHQKAITHKGGTMRLGSYDCKVAKGSKAYESYGTEMIQERHRHRFEFNNDFQKMMEAKGMLMSGINPDSNLVEIIELPDHPWFVGVQFHPEYKSTVAQPHPLFVGFVNAAKIKAGISIENDSLVNS
jgi:CTP synthase